MNEVETEFLKSQELQPFYGFVILTTGTHGTQELDSFLNELNKFHPNLSFTCETSKERVNFLHLNVSLKMVQLLQIFMISLEMDTNISIISHLI